MKTGCNLDVCNQNRSKYHSKARSTEQKLDKKGLQFKIWIQF